MPDKLSYDDAMRVAGELYGNLFARNSDKEGYDYALKSLLSGEKSPRLLVLEFMTSDEFRELHLMNQTPNEFARRIITRLIGTRRHDPAMVKEIALQVLQQDWRDVMRSVINSKEYLSTHGENKIPLWM